MKLHAGAVTQCVPLLILFLFLMLAAFVASAGEAQVCWTPPTQNTDGSPLTDLAGYKILYGTDPSMLAAQQSVTAPATCSNVSSLTVGTWYFAVIAVNAAGAVSDQSNTANKLIVISVIDTNVYKQSQAINGYSMVKVGTIPLNSPCVDSHVVDGFNLLPDRTQVTYLCGGTPCAANKTIMPTSVFAKCQ